MLIELASDTAAGKSPVALMPRAARPLNDPADVAMSQSASNAAKSALTTTARHLHTRPAGCVHLHLRPSRKHKTQRAFGGPKRAEPRSLQPHHRQDTL